MRGRISNRNRFPGRSTSNVESLPQAELVDGNAGGSNDSGVIEARLVDAPIPNMTLGPCPACGCPRDPQSRFCVACGTPLETPGVALQTAPSKGAPTRTAGPGQGDINSQELPSKVFHCKNCGSDVATSTDQRSYICPFCDSAYVVEIDPNISGRRRPEFVIGFAVTKDQAKEKFAAWLKENAWFRPGDLRIAAIADKQRGVYLPFWHFSMEADSRWSATIGEYWYRTETYVTKDSNGKTVTRTRQVQETEWWPLSGRHQKYFYGYLVSASKGLPQKDALGVQPFQLNALTRYRPWYLAGWMSEEYSIDPQDAHRTCEEEFRRREQKAVAAFLPGNTHRNLNVTTTLRTGDSDLILLPVHILTYRYKERIFRFLVNGQTGKVVGEKPVSGKRIAAAIVTALVIIAIIVLTVVVLANQ